MFRVVVRALVALATMSAVAVGVAPANAAPAPVSAAPVVVAPLATPRLVDVDVQEFRRFDRLFLRFRGGVPDLDARYVRVVRDQFGDEVDLPGRAVLLLRLEPARARGLDRELERFDGDNVRGFQLVSDRRGVVRLAVGVRERQRIRTIELRNVLIVDVLHRDRFRF